MSPKFICLSLIPDYLLKNDAKYRKIAIPVSEIIEVSEIIDPFSYGNVNVEIKSMILMKDGDGYYSSDDILLICRMINDN